MSLMNLLSLSFDFVPMNLNLNLHRLRVENLNLIRFSPLFDTEMSYEGLDDFHDLLGNEQFSGFIEDFRPPNFLNHQMNFSFTLIGF